MANDAVPVDAASFYATLSPGRKAALHAEFQQRYAPARGAGYTVAPQQFQEFLKTPQALAVLLGTGFQPGVTPNQAPLVTQNAAQYAQGRANAQAYESRVANDFNTGIGPLLQLANSMARIERGRVTTPQFNYRTGNNNFLEFAQQNQAPNSFPGAPPFSGTAPTANPNAAFNRPVFPGHRASAQNPFDGPSQQEFVSAVQGGLRLGKGIKGRSY